MLTEFLQTGNGTVVVNGLQPQPISGFHVNTTALSESLMQLILPRNANGAIVPGAYSGEVMIQAYDPASGDTYTNLLAISIKNFAGVTSVVADLDLYLTKTGTLAAASDSLVVLPSGDVNFLLATGVAGNINVSGIGLFLII